MLEFIFKPYYAYKAEGQVFKKAFLRKLVFMVFVEKHKKIDFFCFLGQPHESEHNMLMIQKRA